MRLLPLSVTLLLAATGVPRLWPAPRRVVSPRGLAPCSRGSSRWSVRSRSAPGHRSSPVRCSSPGSVSVRSPSQLGAVTVSAMPDEMSGEVGGLQRTPRPSLGASLGRGLAGSVLIGALAILRSWRASRPTRRAGRRRRAAGVGRPRRRDPFLSDESLDQALTDARGGPDDGAGGGRREHSRPDRRVADQPVGALA